MSDASPQRSPQTSSILAALTFGTLCPAGLLILPGLLVLLAQQYGFDEQHLAWLSFADLGGLTIGTALSSRILPRIGVKFGAQLGLAIALVVNLASAAVSAYVPLLGLRFLGGLASGIPYAVCFLVLSRSKQVDRNFSMLVLWQVIFGAIGLQALPYATTLGGVPSVFLLLAGLFAISIFLARSLPAAVGIAAAGREASRAGAAAWTAVAAILVFFVAQGGVWAYLQIIGVQSGVEANAAAAGVALSALVSLVGPLLGVIFGARFGRLAPLLAGLCMTVTSLVLLTFKLNMVRFALAACLFNVAWNFTAPYQLAALAAGDPTGRLVGWAASITLAGVAMGPPVAAFALGAAGVSGVIWVSVALCVLSFSGFIPVLAKMAARDKQQLAHAV